MTASSPWFPENYGAHPTTLGQEREERNMDQKLALCQDHARHVCIGWLTEAEQDGALCLNAHCEVVELRSSLRYV